MSKWVRRLVPCMAVLLTACHTVGGAYLPVSEVAQFTPLSADKRVMNEVRVRWEIRPDVQAFCASTMRMDSNSAYFTPPLACAIWNVPRAECTIVTGSSPSHLVLGHELRHCFEGHFHS